MSTRTRIGPYPVIIAGDMSGNLTSKVTILQSISEFSYALNWSGTSPVGTVSVQFSNDYVLAPDGQTVLNAGTWTAAAISVNGSSATTAPVSGNTGTGFIDASSSAYAVRLIYTAGSGTGSLNTVILGKVS